MTPDGVAGTLILFLESTPQTVFNIFTCYEGNDILYTFKKYILDFFSMHVNQCVQYCIAIKYIATT